MGERADAVPEAAVQAAAVAIAWHFGPDDSPVDAARAALAAAAPLLPGGGEAEARCAICGASCSRACRTVDAERAPQEDDPTPTVTPEQVKRANEMARGSGIMRTRSRPQGDRRPVEPGESIAFGNNVEGWEWVTPAEPRPQDPERAPQGDA